MESTIFSIGHGNKSIQEFIDELKSHCITFLLDVRSKPYSRWNPHFNRESLALDLEENGINYVFVGDALGGLPSDRSCYDKQGKVVYSILKEKDFFKSGLERLKTAQLKGIKLALMCSESKPGDCHRSKLIGQELVKHGVSIQHILPGAKLKTQELVMNELTKGRGTTDLFGNDLDFTSKKSY